MCLPILAVTTLVCCRYRESWRPAWVVAGSVFSLNLVVLILKVVLGRAQPESADPSFFAGGMAYPSGHTSNIVLVYGLVVYLLGRYRGVGRVARRSCGRRSWLLSLTMVGTSLTLNWHWFADLVAGLLIGAMVLELTVAVDAAVPQSAFTRGPIGLLRAQQRRLRPAAPDPTTGPAAAPGAEPLPRRDAS